MAVLPVPARRPSVIPWSVLVLLLALVAIAAAAGARAPGSWDRSEAGRSGAARSTESAAPPGLAEDLLVPGSAPREKTSSTNERLRIPLFGGNPIFALDWLASAADVEAGRIGPGSPVP